VDDKEVELYYLKEFCPSDGMVKFIKFTPLKTPDPVVENCADFDGVKDEDHKHILIAGANIVDSKGTTEATVRYRVTTGQSQTVLDALKALLAENEERWHDEIAPLLSASDYDAPTWDQEDEVQSRLHDPNLTAIYGFKIVRWKVPDIHKEAGRTAEVIAEVWIDQGKSQVDAIPFEPGSEADEDDVQRLFRCDIVRGGNDAQAGTTYGKGPYMEFAIERDTNFKKCQADYSVLWACILTNFRQKYHPLDIINKRFLVDGVTQSTPLEKIKNFSDVFPRMREWGKVDPFHVGIAVGTTRSGYDLEDGYHISLVGYYSNEQAKARYQGSTGQYELETAQKTTGCLVCHGKISQCPSCDGSGTVTVDEYELEGQAVFQAFLHGDADYGLLLQKHSQLDDTGLRFDEWTSKNHENRKIFEEEMTERALKVWRNQEVGGAMNKLAATASQLLESVQKAAARTGAITANVKSSQKLKGSAQSFERQAQEVETKYWWMKMKTMVCVYFCPVLILVFVAHSAYVFVTEGKLPFI